MSTWEYAIERYRDISSNLPAFIPVYDLVCDLSGHPRFHEMIPGFSHESLCIHQKGCDAYPFLAPRVHVIKNYHTFEVSVAYDESAVFKKDTVFPSLLKSTTLKYLDECIEVTRQGSSRGFPMLVDVQSLTIHRLDGASTSMSVFIDKDGSGWAEGKLDPHEPITLDHTEFVVPAEQFNSMLSNRGLPLPIPEGDAPAAYEVQQVASFLIEVQDNEGRRSIAQHPLPLSQYSFVRDLVDSVIARVRILVSTSDNSRCT